MSGKTILVVDDSKVSRMMTSALIKDIDTSYEILEADGGESAIEVCRSHNVDFFSVDLNMPGMDGLELIRILKPEHPAAKFSLLTANVQDSTREKCDELGIKYTEKPVTEECINQMLEYFND